MAVRNFADEARDSLLELAATLEDVGAVAQSGMARAVVDELAPFAFFFRRPPSVVPAKMLACLDRVLTALEEIDRYLEEVGLEGERATVHGVRTELRQVHLRLSRPKAPSLVG